jgi:hypothetical protein
MVSQIGRQHTVAAFGERHASGLPVTRRTKKSVENDERRTGTTEFADD